ncbi:hypothetical protein [Duganella lactea]|nr:hypothetical protein [Duganella lactea]
MIRVILVDDEAPARANLKALLRRQGDIDIIAECDAASSGDLRHRL